MLYEIGVEDIEPNHWIAWVFGLPGCFASAATREAVLTQVPEAIAAYAAWRTERGRPVPRGAEGATLHVAELFRAYPSEGDYLVNAFFAHDRRPLTPAEVEDGLWLLGETRRDLLAAATPGDDASELACDTVLRHLAGAERWYFEQLGFAQPRPPEVATRAIVQVRERSRAWLAELAGDERISEEQGERWSARKVLRRTLWHERTHTLQIRRLATLAAG